jgi:hypothetical protein
MELETVRAGIINQGLSIIGEVELNGGVGTQLRTAEGPVLDVYKSGKCVLGGKKQHLLRPILQDRVHGQSLTASSEADRLARLEAENKQLKALLARRNSVIEPGNPGPGMGCDDIHETIPF